MSCGLHDVVALEGRGTPAALVATEVFHDTAVEQARILGQPDALPIEVPHPVQPTDPAVIAGWADRVVDAAIARLTAPD